MIRVPVTTYADAVEYLNKLMDAHIDQSRELIFKGMEILLDSLGHPERKLPAVHITGTSGKGSTTYLIASLLQHAGYKVGCLTSPHLQEPTERLSINGNHISENEFTQLIQQIGGFLSSHPAEYKEGLFKFGGLLTAFGLQWFAQHNCDILAAEVYVGGTYDTTNVVQSRVAVVTNVDLDHMQILGNTVEEIATHKAGIIKPGCTAITGATQESVLQIIREQSAKAGAPLLVLGQEIQVTPYIYEKGSEGQYFDLKINDTLYKEIYVPLLGRHQLDNAALAVAAAILADTDHKLTEERIRTALSLAHIPGRAELVHPSSIPILLDGAHNPAKMRSLADTLREYCQWRKLWLIFGCKPSKPADEMLEAILPLADHILVTGIHEGGSSELYRADPEILAGSVRRLAPRKMVKACEQLQDAISYACTHADAEDLICITGSLYIAGEARGILTTTS